METLKLFNNNAMGVDRLDADYIERSTAWINGSKEGNLRDKWITVADTLTGPYWVKENSLLPSLLHFLYGAVVVPVFGENVSSAILTGVL